MTRPDADGEPLLLGAELAQASEAEERHDHPGVSPLDNRRYARHEQALDRFVASELDYDIRALTTEFEHGGERTRSDLRARLTMDDFYTLFTFVRRSVVHAIRSRDPVYAQRALLSLAMVDPLRVDRRDLMWAVDIAVAMLNHMGEDVAQAMNEAASLAPSPELLTSRPTWTTLAGARYYVVRGEQPGLVQHGGRPFDPSHDLVACGQAVASVFEGDGKVADLQVGSSLPGVWFKLRHSEPEREVSGTITITCTEHDHPGGLARHMLTAFLSEFHDVATAADYEESSNNHDGRTHANLSVRHGALLCVLIARAVDHRVDPVETSDSLERFRAGIERALKNAQ